VSVAADVPNPSLERYPHRAKAPAKKSTVAAVKKKPVSVPAPKKTTH